ncbi:hypothetical protein N9K06_01485 [Omnitrophica bacterium]|nr:hypothetical protein [Candidatus Omnitrophota bacterium]
MIRIRKPVMKDLATKGFFLGLFGAVMFCHYPRPAYSAVGQAERYDEFDKMDLDEFQENLLKEQEERQSMETGDVISRLQKSQAQLETAPGVGQEKIKKDIEKLKMQLLVVPDKDRLKFQFMGNHQYESNRNRQKIHSEKGDTSFDSESRVLVDLSGKKTDLRFELGLEKNWNIIFSENDSWQVEERLRYRRKYFKKVSHSSNSRIARNQSKTIEIDGDKIRWDFSNQTAFNYPFSRKLSLNFDLQQTKRLFQNEAFDQDSSWEVQASPSAFWNFTSKTRVQAGYTFGANRSRIKSGDANSHNFRVGYFGKITQKSSTSLDLSYSYQDPRSRDTAIVKTSTIGIGYLWQMTPKTQISTEFIRSVQNSTSDLVSGDRDGINTTSKTDTHFVSENITISLNSRLMKKLTATVTWTGTHTRNKTFKEGDEDVESRQFTFPVSVGINYIIRKGINLNLRYSFAYRRGDEQDENSRAHTINSALRMIF